MLIADKYRLIELAECIALDDNADAAITRLNGQFHSDDFYVARSGCNATKKLWHIAMDARI